MDTAAEELFSRVRQKEKEKGKETNANVNETCVLALVELSNFYRLLGLLSIANQNNSFYLGSKKLHRFYLAKWKILF
jgi:hypothetical protein